MKTGVHPHPLNLDTVFQRYDGRCPSPGCPPHAFAGAGSARARRTFSSPEACPEHRRRGEGFQPSPSETLNPVHPFRPEKCYYCFNDNQDHKDRSACIPPTLAHRQRQRAETASTNVDVSKASAAKPIVGMGKIFRKEDSSCERSRRGSKKMAETPPFVPWLGSRLSILIAPASHSVEPVS